MKDVIGLIDSALEKLFKEKLFGSDKSSYPFSINSYEAYSHSIPQKNWCAGKHESVADNHPIINIYLFDIQEAKELNQSSDATTSINENKITKIEANPYIHLFYIITVYGINTNNNLIENEHQLLSELLKIVLSNKYIPKKHLYEYEVQSSLPKIAMELVHTKLLETGDSLNIWSALDQYLKPALYLKVTVPVNIDKKIESSMVLSKMIQLGVPSSKYYYTLALRPSISNDYPNNNDQISIAKVNLTSSVVKNKEKIVSNQTNIVIYKNDGIEAGDILIIKDEDKTEFITINDIQIISIAESDTKIIFTVRNKLLYDHEVGTELRKIDVANAQILNDIHFISIPQLNKNILKIFGSDVKYLEKNDLIYLIDKNTTQKEYFQIINKTDHNIDILSQFIQIGGIVKNAKKIPLKNIKIQLFKKSILIESTTTNVDGQFTFSRLEAECKDYSLKIPDISKNIKLNNLKRISQKELIITI